MNDSKNLFPSEWILISAFVLFMAAILVISKTNSSFASKKISEELSYKRDEIGLQITGAVAKPGLYTAPLGTILEKVIKKAGPRPSANLRALDLTERVVESREIFISELEEITVAIEGAIEAPLELTLPPGARVRDLKSKVSLIPSADRKFFYRKRLLKDGEKIFVPEKKEKD